MQPIDDHSTPEASSKNRILKSAERTFAQRGFEGARVDEIARRAGVNKALIYYYFKSKEEILHALIHSAIQDLTAHFGEPSELLEQSLSSPAVFNDIITKFLAFLEERRDLFSIIVMELFKDSDRKILILSHLGEEIQGQLAIFEKFRVEDDRLQLLTTEFFTGFMPVLLYVLLKDEWKSLYGLDEGRMRAMFLKAFEATHLRYTLDLINRKGSTASEGKREWIQ